MLVKHQRLIFSMLFIWVLSCQDQDTDIIREDWGIADKVIILKEMPFEGQIVDTISILGETEGLSFYFTEPLFMDVFKIAEEDGIISVSDTTPVQGIVDTCIFSYLIAVADIQRDTAHYEVCLQYELAAEIDFLPVYRVRADENPNVGDTVIDLNIDGKKLRFRIAAPDSLTSAIAIGDAGLVTIKDSSFFDYELTEELIFEVEVFRIDQNLGAFKLIVSLNQKADELNPNVWNGEELTFEKESGTDPFLVENQDRISQSLWISRRNDGGALLNMYSESKPDNYSPDGSLWALGTVDQLSDLSFMPLREVINPRELPGSKLIMYDKKMHFYVPMVFLSWDNGGKQGTSGGFSYRRRTPGN